MKCGFTDDPVKDAANRDAEAEEWLNSRPVCCHCGDHIQDEFYFEIEGRIYCPDCVDDAKQWID